MEWLWGLPILPALLCGLMCVVGIVLAALGRRHSTARRACCDQEQARKLHREGEMTVGR